MNDMKAANASKSNSWLKALAPLDYLLIAVPVALAIRWVPDGGGACVWS